MIKTLRYLNIAAVLLSICFSSTAALAVTKPANDADLSNYSYVFYLYYDSGQLVGDRDYQVKFDVINEKFVQPSVTGKYKLQIFTAKSEVASSVNFDPRNGNPNMTKGKVQVKAPYVADGVRASFFDDQGRQLMTIFISSAALCNDDGFCSSASGENERTCPADCKKAGVTPRASVAPATTPVSEGVDYIMLAIYGIAGVGVAVGAWFGWRWWKKRKEENFTPPSSPNPPPANPPAPPLNPGL